ncbi:MAG: threonine synthase [Candidatus Krumholzibacteriota bacterium]
MSGPLDSLPAVACNPHWIGYRCVVCDREYEAGYDGFVCADCGVDGILDVVYDYSAIRNAGPVTDPGLGGLWGFAPLLPVRPQADHHAWNLGRTPAHRADRLAAHLGLHSLVLKDDTCLPSASLKDRAAAVAIARARQLGIDHLACASTGNAATSLAVLAARAGMTSTIFVPASAPRAKLAQLVLHGATVIPVDGSYDQAFDLSLKEITKYGWYSRNCAHNPLLVEGKKTAALELAWSLTGGFTGNDRDLPDAVMVPVGDGCIISSVCKAFRELHEVGMIGKIPRVIGVQAAGASPLARAWAAAGKSPAELSGPEILTAVRPVVAQTIADSIQVGTPRNRVKAWKNITACGGAFLAVEDESIVEAISMLARLAGIFAEPSGAAGLAGIITALDQGLVNNKENIAVLVTGHGLKDPGAGLTGMTMPDPVPPLPAGD